MRYTEFEEASEVAKPAKQARKLVKVRDQPGFREHGFKPFFYTYETIADLAGLSVRTVRGAASCRDGGSPPELDPRSLESVVNFINKRREIA